MLVVVFFGLMIDLFVCLSRNGRFGLEYFIEIMMVLVLGVLIFLKVWNRFLFLFVLVVVVLCLNENFMVFELNGLLFWNLMFLWSLNV